MRAFTRTARAARSYKTLTQLPRSFWSTSGRKAEAAAAEAEDYTVNTYLERHYADYADKPQHGTILYNWGAFSWWSLATITCLSKEIYVADGMAISGWIPDIAVIMTAAYFFGPALGNEYDKTVDWDRKLKIEAFEATDALIDVKVGEITALENQPVKLEEFVTEYRAALEAQTQAEHRQAQYDHYAQTVATLDALVGKQNAEGAALANIDSELIMDNLVKAFSDPAVVNASIEEAIANIESGEFGACVDKIVNDYTASDQFDLDFEAKVAELEQDN